MVFSAASEAEPLPKRMATEKPHPLHNFSMPVLKWGNQRILRCMKPSPHGEISGSSLARRLQPSDAGSAGGSSLNLSGVRKPLTPSPLEKLRKTSPLRPQPPPEEESADAGIERLRAKLEDHLQTAADQMRYKVPEQREDAEPSQPWNLRTRRAALKAPAVESGGGNGGSAPPLAVLAAAAGNSTRSRLRGLAADSQIVEKKEKMKFSVPLSREEIEEDFFIITGSRPPRRPKKRAKMIQRQLDEVFPGLWLSEITPDTYKVDDLPEAGKENGIDQKDEERKIIINFQSLTGKYFPILSQDNLTHSKDGRKNLMVPFLTGGIVSVPGNKQSKQCCSRKECKREFLMKNQLSVQ